MKALHYDAGVWTWVFGPMVDGVVRVASAYGVARSAVGVLAVVDSARPIRVPGPRLRLHPGGPWLCLTRSCTLSCCCLWDDC